VSKNINVQAYILP